MAFHLFLDQFSLKGRGKRRFFYPFSPCVIFWGSFSGGEYCGCSQWGRKGCSVRPCSPSPPLWLPLTSACHHLSPSSSALWPTLGSGAVWGSQSSQIPGEDVWVTDVLFWGIRFSTAKGWVRHDCWLWHLRAVGTCSPQGRISDCQASLTGNWDDFDSQPTLSLFTPLGFFSIQYCNLCR